MFDLYTYPFGFRGQQEYAGAPGFFVGTAHRKAVRTREIDMIVMNFTPYREMDENERAYLTDFLDKVAYLYFKSNGPITTVVKTCGEFLNELLIKANQGKSISSALSGALQFLVFHENEVYIAYCGASAAFVISKLRSFQVDDRTGGSQGLGFSKAIKFKFSHAELQHGDRIVLSSKAPSDWTIEILAKDPRFSISHLRKTLLQRAKQDFEAVILQVRSGTGNVHALNLGVQPADGTAGMDADDFDEQGFAEKDEVFPLAATVMDREGINAVRDPVLPLRSADQPTAAPAPQERSYEGIPTPPFMETAASAGADAKQPLRQPVPEQDLPMDRVTISGRSEEPAAQIPFPGAESWEESRRKIQPQTPAVETGDQETQEVVPEPRKPLAGKRETLKVLNSIKNFLINVTGRTDKINRSISQNTARLISRANPSARDSSNALSSTSMFFMAILVPIIVVTIATTVYFRYGRSEQHDKFVLNANQLITDANAQTDIGTRLVYYQDALLFLDEAEKYGSSEASAQMRTMIQTELDRMQGVTRINLQGTIAGGLDRRLQIVRMVVSSREDIYALDGGTGRVLRLVYTSNGYEIDTTFVCGSGRYGQVPVHELVDIELVGVNNSLNAVVLGIDRGGNILLCSVGAEPTAVSVMAPEMGWGEIKAIAFNGYSAYILDVDERTRDVYRLPANGLRFDGNPEPIFIGNIPENLTGMRDLAIYDTDLFLLHESGELMGCALGNEINCRPDIGYGLIQGEQERQTTSAVAGTNFSQIQTTQPPDPSVFFLDELNAAVHHYSLAMNMQKQIRPNFLGSFAQPEGTLTAFTVSPYGIIHFAFGYQLFYGYLP